MATATLFWVRHGKTVMNQQKVWSGRTDCDLSIEGKNETKKAFENYSSEDFDMYFCSPLKRTRQTLDCIVPGQTPIIDWRIIERDFGDWEGQPFSVIDAETTERYIRGEVEPPNGETFEEVKNRVSEFVDYLFTTYPGKKILIVSHATVLRMVRDLYLPKMEKKPITNSQMLIVRDTDFYAIR